MNSPLERLKQWQWPFRRTMGAALFAVVSYGVLIGAKKGQNDIIILAIGVLMLAVATFDFVIGEVAIGYDRTLTKSESPNRYWFRAGGWAFIGVWFILMALLMRFFPHGL